MIELSARERNALPKGAKNFKTRLKRLRAFDDLAFDKMKEAIHSGDITDEVSSEVASQLEAALRDMPETLAEMTLYTLRVEILVHGKNTRAGWPWARRTVKRYMHTECIFSPYSSKVSALTSPDGVVRFQ